MTRAEIDSFILCLGGFRLGGRSHLTYVGVPGVAEPITFGGQWQRRVIRFAEVREWLINRGADKARIDECWERHGVADG